MLLAMSQDNCFLLQHKQRRRTLRRQLACDHVHSCVRNRSPSEPRSMMCSRAAELFPGKITYDPILFSLDFSNNSKRPIPDDVEWFILVQEGRRTGHCQSLKRVIWNLIEVSSPTSGMLTDRFIRSVGASLNDCLESEMK